MYAIGLLLVETKSYIVILICRNLMYLKGIFLAVVVVNCFPANLKNLYFIEIKYERYGPTVRREETIGLFRYEKV